MQYVDATTVTISTLYDTDTQNVGGASLTGVVNVIGARVDNGSASITGKPNDLTQSFTLNLNSLQVGGTLQGVVEGGTPGIVDPGRDATLMRGTFGGTSPLEADPQLATVGYVNLAVANANVGPATLTNVSQSMNQALNTVAAAQGVNFNLNQEVTIGTAEGRGCTICSNNIQVAAGSSATITGAFQSIRNTVNIASIGSLSGNSTINQATSNLFLHRSWWQQSADSAPHHHERYD